jgi:hypothetical protein
MYLKMETIVTVGALESLNKNLEFLLTKQGVPYDKAMEMQEAVFAKIRKIPDNPFIGQLEVYLPNPTKNYRRLI